ncbi:hypothetical protein [Streptomyces sp. CRN 30]|uniref:hypothetical protein n=1 Tax=Streptomyces sp. CRN 30 TaxID=3075613 RepID=UPI002A841AF3|nr:hypothetical protein [Streptomyces sp. CRN 30]
MSNSIRVGGDAHGPVVAGDRNRVEVRAAAPADHPAGPVQNVTADNGATLYAVMNGNQTVERAAAGEEGTEDGPAAG